MQEISFARLLAFGLIAALCASTIGTALLLWDEIAGHPLRHLLGESGRYSRSPASEWMVYPIIWEISLFGTIPGSLLIGAPAIYPFRHVISRHPFSWLVPALAYAAIITTLLFWWTITPTAYGVRYYDILWFYSASSALGFVAALAWWGRRQRRMKAE
jgi:hypothetical protein